MKGQLLKNATKVLLIPTLVLGGLTACGYNDGARTNTYNGTTTYDGARSYTYDGYNTNNYNGARSYTYDRYNTNNYNGARNYTYDRYNTNNYNGVGPYATGYNNRTNPFGAGVNQRVASRVATVAKDVPGVNRATAIVYRNDIVVGIGSNSNKDVRALEQKVRSAVQNKEPGYNVHVTTDKNIHTRIRSIHTNMNNYNTRYNTNTTTNTASPGHPIRDLGTDIGAVIRDIGRTVTAPLR